MKIPAQKAKARVKHVVGGVTHFINGTKPKRRHGGDSSGGRNRKRGY